MRIRSRHPATAFTLIEVLLALAILGMIVTAIYSSWTAILRGSKAGLDAAAQVHRERIARTSLETALSSAILYGENVRYYSFNADTADDRFASLSLVAHLPESFPGSGLFPGNPVRRVTFSVEPGTNGNSLVLWQQVLLLPTNVTDGAVRIELAQNVGLFGLEFWDTNLNDWGSEWLSSNQLPKLVRATLGFGQNGAGAPQQLASTVVAVPAMTVTREIQMPDPQGGAGAGRNKESGKAVSGKAAGQPGGVQINPGQLPQPGGRPK